MNYEPRCNPGGDAHREWIELFLADGGRMTAYGSPKTARRFRVEACSDPVSAKVSFTDRLVPLG
jgi:hypothetical protein